ncbi:1-deoxy-D-xylulose-5-phosphate synthase [uncultured archaeon]|nr:1-deoxy-D-xylulose-5-phosphate synthase [uncultured archaeon]
MSAIRLNSISDLQRKANDVRADIINMLLPAKSGHTAGPLGMADIFTALYFHTLEHDPAKPQWSGRDRVVLSNGHIAPVLYAVLGEAGYFDKKLFSTLRKLGSPLQGHPHRGALAGIETSSGPLGQGLSQACGMALAAKMDGQKHVIWCLTSDGEHEEGQTWEAVLLAAKYKLGNLVQIMDRNFIQIDGRTEDIMPLESMAAKYKAFNWRVIEIDGNDMKAAVKALDEARTNAVSNPDSAPTIIIAKTVPGRGVSFMENKYEWHGKPPNEEEAKLALAELQAQRAKIKA